MTNIPDDDLIDTIAEAIEDAERSFGSGEYHQFATHVTDLIRERHAIVRLPEATPDWHGGLTRWEVPIIGQRRPGEVTIRKSDNRIGVDAGIPLDNADDATALAAALLAAAAVWTPADTTEVGSHRRAPGAHRRSGVMPAGGLPGAECGGPTVTDTSWPDHPTTDDRSDRD